MPQEWEKPARLPPPGWCPSVCRQTPAAVWVKDASSVSDRLPCTHRDQCWAALLRWQQDAAHWRWLSQPGTGSGAERACYTAGRIFRLGFAVINNENKIKRNRLFAEREVSLSWGLQGLESQWLKSQVLPTSQGCRWPLVPAWLRSSVLPAESQAFPRIWGNVCFLVNWNITARSNYAGTAPHLQSSGHYIPSGLQSMAMVRPKGTDAGPEGPPCCGGKHPVKMRPFLRLTRAWCVPCWVSLA